LTASDFTYIQTSSFWGSRIMCFNDPFRNVSIINSIIQFRQIWFFQPYPGNKPSTFGFQLAAITTTPIRPKRTMVETGPNLVFVVQGPVCPRKVLSGPLSKAGFGPWLFQDHGYQNSYLVKNLYSQFEHQRGPGKALLRTTFRTNLSWSRTINHKGLLS
jgi:hypothetical protein